MWCLGMGMEYATDPDAVQIHGMVFILMWDFQIGDTCRLQFGVTVIWSRFSQILRVRDSLYNTCESMISMA